MVLDELLTLLLFAVSDRKGGPGEFRVENDPIQVSRADSTSGLYIVNGIYDLRNAIRFRLWTRDNPRLAQEVVVHDLRSLRSSNYDPKRLTKIFVHGKDHRANEERLDPETVFMRDAYLRFADVNYVLVDWTSLARNVRYFTNYGDLVTDRLVHLLQFLARHGSLQLHTVHLIGMSWGAHIVGNAGHRLGGKIGRITGLDPAGPLYEGLGQNYTLDRTDAGFVDVIHSDGGPIAGIHFGTANPTAHVDFFPNGGGRQPGCPPISVRHFRESACSHERSVLLFVESIGSPLSFPSCQANSWDSFLRTGHCPTGNLTFMGEHVPSTARGIYYLRTKGQRPYGLGPKLDVILPTIPGSPRPNRKYVFDFNRFRFQRPQSTQTASTIQSGVAVTKTESDFRPWNDGNVDSYSHFQSYTPDTFPNNDVLAQSLALAFKSQPMSQQTTQ